MNKSRHEQLIIGLPWINKTNKTNSEPPVVEPTLVELPLVTLTCLILVML